MAAEPTPGGVSRAPVGWRDANWRLVELRCKLEGRAVPSYRVGTAEGFTLFEGLPQLNGLVEESFVALQERITTAREADAPSRDD